jgi:transposase
MDLFAGLDVSLKETSICVIDTDGKIIRDTKVPSEPEAIRYALGDFADRLGRVGIETSSLGIWLHRELNAAGLRVIVVEARHIPPHTRSAPRARGHRRVKTLGQHPDQGLASQGVRQGAAKDRGAALPAQGAL